jgi:hypothetical protein
VPNIAVKSSDPISLNILMVLSSILSDMCSNRLERVWSASLLVFAPSEAGAASGLSNMLRNLGGAVGTATLATVLTKREQFHSNIIVKRQALIIGFSDTFAVIGSVLAIAAIALLFARKVKTGSGAGAH